MTAPLGTTTCGVLGCTRRRHASADGRIRYGRCLAHTLIAQSNAFGDPQQGRGREVSPRASVSASLPVAVPAYRPAA